MPIGPGIPNGPVLKGDQGDRFDHRSLEQIGVREVIYECHLGSAPVYLSSQTVCVLVNDHFQFFRG